MTVVASTMAVMEFSKRRRTTGRAPTVCDAAEWALVDALKRRSMADLAATRGGYPDLYSRPSKRTGNPDPRQRFLFAPTTHWLALMLPSLSSLSEASSARPRSENALSDATLCEPYVAIKLPRLVRSLAYEISRRIPSHEGLDERE